MHIVISDTSSVIDLHLAKLLESFLRLPHKIVVPRPLFEDELLSLTVAEKRRLIQKGLEVWDIPGEGVATARSYFNTYRWLKLNDCFALVMAESNARTVLLTGDRRLTNVAVERGVKTHGVLWATDEIYEHKCCTPAKLRAGLKLLSNDPLVFLPNDLLQKRLHKYR
ncbi:MAG: PIN domain-containing protein [Gammaproteobacteria bacterium]